MHLDPLLALVVARAVGEAVEIEVALELAIDAAEQVAVEGRRHALGVVVSGFEPLAILDQVDAEEQEAVLRATEIDHPS